MAVPFVPPVSTFISISLVLAWNLNQTSRCGMPQLLDGPSAVAPVLVYAASPLTKEVVLLIIMAFVLLSLDGWAKTPKPKNTNKHGNRIFFIRVILKLTRNNLFSQTHNCLRQAWSNNIGYLIRHFLFIRSRSAFIPELNLFI